MVVLGYLASNLFLDASAGGKERIVVDDLEKNQRKWPIHNRLLEGMDKYGLPVYMKDTVIRYVMYGTMPGHFLTALCADRLNETWRRADDQNRPLLHKWAQFVYSYFPMGCWGSSETVNKWVDQGGYIGLMEEDD